MADDADQIKARAAGPFVVWQYHAFEGWHPESYASLKEAVEAQKWNEIWVVQRPVEYSVNELSG